MDSVTGFSNTYNWNRERETLKIYPIQRDLFDGSRDVLFIYLFAFHVMVLYQLTMLHNA
jgi:hypothetical protein